MIPLPKPFLTQPIAHRALHDRAAGRPENSRAAIEAAIERGYGIEIDLQLSRDDQAMVFHDYDLGRLTAEQGAVKQRSSDELRHMTLLGGNEGVPSFAEVLNLVRGRVPLLVELKDQHGAMGDTDGTLERAAAATLQGYSGPVAVMSFNPNMTARMADLLPQVPRGIVTCAYSEADRKEMLVPEHVADHLRDIADYERSQASFISHHWADLSRPRVAELKAKGAAILCWTIRSQHDEKQARRLAENVTFEGYMADHGA